MAFTDKIDIEISAGKGGDGLLSFRQEKYMAKGGPDGGNGGKGGDVIFEVDHNLNTLSFFRNHKKLQANDGGAGGTNTKNGRGGQDAVVKVPEGTMVFEGDRQIADLTTDGQRTVIAHGGRGGFGNAHFVSSKRQVPRVVELGEPGETKKVTLELKLVADIGLIGLPNAGKSTLLSVISNAKPEIADYPFTTLIPNLGVTDIDGYTVLVADIPGLIEGASHGKGLGDEFLRHVERTAVLIHLVDSNSPDPVKDYKVIMGELKAYLVDLSSRPQIVVLSKIDSLQGPALSKTLAKVKKATSQEVYAISAVAHKGLTELMRAALPAVKKAREIAGALQAEAEIFVIDEASLPDLWQITKEDEGYRVQGTKIERFVLRTQWGSDEAVARLRDILRKMGIAKQLEKQGIKRGDKVLIGDHSLEWL